MFTERKATQIAAFFLDKAGGKMSPIKLIKMMYLADRESYRKYCFPISDDDVAAMKHGPVLVGTLNLTISPSGYWSNLISKWNGHSVDRLHSWYDQIPESEFDIHQVELIRELDTERDRGELSKGGMDIMESIFNEYGSMSCKDVVDNTHKLEEWERNYKNGYMTIRPEHILRAVGKGREEAETYRLYLKESWQLSAAMASIQEEYNRKKSDAN